MEKKKIVDTPKEWKQIEAYLHKKRKLIGSKDMYFIILKFSEKHKDESKYIKLIADSYDEIR